MNTMTLDNHTSAAQLNVAMYRYLGQIAADESLMAKAVKYVQKLAATKEKKTRQSILCLLQEWLRYYKKATRK